MGRKSGKFKKKEDEDRPKKKSIRFDSGNEDMMDDDIDVFHKKRDVVPLNINEDVEESDEDAEQPVLDFEDEDEDEDVDDDDKPPKGLAAKIARTQKYLRAKFGDAEDETLDDADEEETGRDFGGKKSDLYGADVGNEPRSSDDEDAAEEEDAVLKRQMSIANNLSMEDYGVEDTSQDESDREPTFQEILDHGKRPSKPSLDKIKDEEGMTYEIVKKDLNALTKEEQMDVVYSSAPELIGLLSELKDSIDQLENKVNPLVEKIKGQESGKKGTMHYIEVKQLLLQSYCQAITFYLLLKSEGQPVRDHPVVSHLVEIKSLLDKIKNIDDNLSFDMEETLKKEVNSAAAVKLMEKAVPVESNSNSEMCAIVASAEQAKVEPNKEAVLNTLTKAKGSQNKHQDKQVGLQSMEMLKIRASLEEKLKQQGVFGSMAPKAVKSSKNQQPVNRQLETFDDFVDEAMEIDAASNPKTALRSNKRKVIAGDDDIPKRDDIGERRRKHELRVLAGAGIRSGEDAEDETGSLSGDEADDANGESDADSDLEFYKQVESKHAARLAEKSSKYSRVPEVPSLPDTLADDGKRHITNQIEKNRGLTRARKKLTKNPRKKYKLKHKKAEVRRKGQVREIRKPTGSYGGEASGINAGISRSVRFKN
ncbi:something about silencing protein 10-like isoform X2 [Salvia splendens]|uniref:something about silencing protein 10-like isoform X2 n=1 Tax=Salvia splendens TaxID=180675 RepID=UPI001C2639C9|nr:something about silencing protein 10-like isoform X2 [Salvia splendens]